MPSEDQGTGVRAGSISLSPQESEGPWKRGSLSYDSVHVASPCHSQCVRMDAEPLVLCSKVEVSVCSRETHECLQGRVGAEAWDDPCRCVRACMYVCD